MKQIVLERMKFAMQTYISTELLDDMHPEVLDSHVWLDVIAQRVVFDLRAHILSNKIHQARWPTDWKEAVKERFAPGWMKRRWPVRYETLDIYRLYPHLAVPRGRDRVFLWSNEEGGEMKHTDGAIGS